MNPQQGDGIFRKQLCSSSSRNDFRDLARRLKMSPSNKQFKALRTVSLPHSDEFGHHFSFKGSANPQGFNVTWVKISVFCNIRHLHIQTMTSFSLLTPVCARGKLSTALNLGPSEMESLFVIIQS